MLLLQKRLDELKRKYPDLTEDIDLNKAFEEFSEAKTVKTIADIVEKSLRGWNEKEKEELLSSFWSDQELAKRVHAPSLTLFQRSLMMAIICLDEKHGIPLADAMEAMKNRLDVKQKVLFTEALQDWGLE